MKRLGRSAGLLMAALAAGLASGCGPARAPEGTYKLDVHLASTELDLPNGLHVVLHREETAQVALVHMRYEVGSTDDPVGRAGLAHLFEHLMFRGSKNTGDRDHGQWLDEVGGRYNATTELDHTDYFATVLPEALPRALWLEADRMAYPLAHLDDDGLARERRVVQNEAREHYDNEPLGNLTAIAREAVYGDGHPYGVPVIGRIRELDAVTLREARAFAAQHYRPNNATLVIAGAIDVERTRELVTRYFATIPAGPARMLRALPPQRPKRSQDITVEANVEGPAVMVAFAAPAEHEPGAEELDFAVADATHYVRRTLVAEIRIAVSVQSSYERNRLGGLVTFLVRLKPGESTRRALEIVNSGIARAASVGHSTTRDTLPDEKTAAIVDEVRTLDELEGRAQRILHDLEFHGKPDALLDDVRRIQNVDAANIGSAAGQFLEAPHVTIVVKPKADVSRAGVRVMP